MLRIVGFQICCGLVVILLQVCCTASCTTNPQQIEDRGSGHIQYSMKFRAYVKPVVSRNCWKFSCSVKSLSELAITQNRQFFSDFVRKHRFHFFIVTHILRQITTQYYCTPKMCTQPWRDRVGFHCLKCHKQTDDVELCISPVYRRLAVAKFTKSTM